MLSTSVPTNASINDANANLISFFISKPILKLVSN